MEEAEDYADMQIVSPDFSFFLITNWSIIVIFPISRQDLHICILLFFCRHTHMEEAEDYADMQIVYPDFSFFLISNWSIIVSFPISRQDLHICILIFLSSE